MMHSNAPSNHTNVYRVTGGQPLAGRVRINGSKNAALPIIIASVMSGEPVTLHNVPRISDVDVILETIGGLGTTYRWLGPNSLFLHTPLLWSVTPAPSLVLKMRATFELWGALLARAGESNLSMPGGCNIGARPVDQHVSAFRQLGYHVTEGDGFFKAERVSRRFQGEVRFDLKTVGGTRNTIMAATLGAGRVVLRNASTEPEVEDMITFLNALGARISIIDADTIEIESVDRLGSGTHTVIPDRMEAGTFMLATAATGGRVTLENTDSGHLEPIISALTKAGISIRRSGADAVDVDARNRVLHPVTVVMDGYPGFPTDLHPLLTTFLTTVPGVSRTSDRIFPERFTHIRPLTSMGANIVTDGDATKISGGPLTPSQIHATDLRAGGALIVAALIATGESTISGLEHIERGYENLHTRLRSLGARISLEASSVNSVVPFRRTLP